GRRMHRARPARGARSSRRDHGRSRPGRDLRPAVQQLLHRQMSPPPQRIGGVAGEAARCAEPSAGFDVVVIGAGHAGCEAALAAARMGCATALVTLDAAAVARMSCNPAIGGLAKGHLVREIDALGGEMGRAIDATGIQFRLLNASRGPAVQAPRAQADKDAYSARMRRVVETTAGLTLVEGEAADLVVEGGTLRAVALGSGRVLETTAAVVTTGTFLGGLLHTGLE